MVRRYTWDRVEYYRSWTPVGKECMMAKSVVSRGVEQQTTASCWTTCSGSKRTEYVYDRADWCWISRPNYNAPTFSAPQLTLTTENPLRHPNNRPFLFLVYAAKCPRRCSFSSKPWSLPACFPNKSPRSLALQALSVDRCPRLLLSYIIPVSQPVRNLTKDQISYKKLDTTCRPRSSRGRHV